MGSSKKVCYSHLIQRGLYIREDGWEGELCKSVLDYKQGNKKIICCKSI